MVIRYALFLSILAFSFRPADAQITLTLDDLPFQLGSRPYTALDTSNDDGSNTSAIQTIISQSGGGQVYDFSGIEFEIQLSGTITVESGATGPGADIGTLSQATRTAVSPFSFEVEEGMVIEGTGYNYLRVTDQDAFNLGTYFEAELGGEPIEFALTNEPAGDRIAVSPTTAGTSWTSEYLEIGPGLDTDISKEYEVDGWGTMILPEVGSVPVLRLKVTEERTMVGAPIISVCYEFRSPALAGATVCEGDDTFMDPPTASVSNYGATTTDAGVAPEDAGSSLRAVYPNPVRGAATLEFEIAQPGAVELVVYDVLGRLVRRVVDGSRAAGRYTATFDTAGLAPGVYVARLSAGGRHWTRRLVITG
jgi:hypothetical protein